MLLAGLKFFVGDEILSVQKVSAAVYCSCLETDSKEDSGELKEDRGFAFQYGKGSMTGILHIQEYPRMSK